MWLLIILLVLAILILAPSIFIASLHYLIPVALVVAIIAVIVWAVNRTRL